MFYFIDITRNSLDFKHTPHEKRKRNQAVKSTVIWWMNIFSLKDLSHNVSLNKKKYTLNSCDDVLCWTIIRLCDSCIYKQSIAIISSLETQFCFFDLKKKTQKRYLVLKMPFKNTQCVVFSQDWLWSWHWSTQSKLFWSSI